MVCLKSNMGTTLSATQGSSYNQKKKTTTVGLRSIAYLGAKLWNENVCNFSDAREIDFSTPKTSIDDPSVLLVDGSDFPYLWYFHWKFLANYVLLMFIVVMLFLSTLSLFNILTSIL